MSEKVWVVTDEGKDRPLYVSTILSDPFAIFDTRIEAVEYSKFLNQKTNLKTCVKEKIMRLE